MHVPEHDVLALIHQSQVLVEKAESAYDGSLRSLKALHKAEQVRLLVRPGGRLRNPQGRTRCSEVQRSGRQGPDQ